MSESRTESFIQFFAYTIWSRIEIICWSVLCVFFYICSFNPIFQFYCNVPHMHSTQEAEEELGTSRPQWGPVQGNHDDSLPWGAKREIEWRPDKRRTRLSTTDRTRVGTVVVESVDGNPYWRRRSWCTAQRSTIDRVVSSPCHTTLHWWRWWWLLIFYLLGSTEQKKQKPNTAVCSLETGFLLIFSRF